MTVPLSRSERERLTKLLAMLGSDHPGERAAAGQAADRLARQAGLTWDELLDPTPVAKVSSEVTVITWRRTCLELPKRPGDLRVWERKFVADLPAFPRISPKQRSILAEIAARVLGRDA